MKNKILAILLSFTLIFTTTALGFAEDEVGSSPEPEKQSEQVVSDTTKKAPAEVKEEVNVEEINDEVQLTTEIPKQMKLQSHDNGHYTIHITFTNDGSTLNINDKNKEYVHFDGENPIIDKSALIEEIKKERPNLEIETINFKVTGCEINSSVHLDATVVPPTPVTKYTVTYEYIGTVPEGAPSAPTAFEKEAEEIITIAQKPEFEGYTFEGWYTNDVIISDGKFEMPEKNVKLTGEWKKIKENVIIHYIDEDGNTVAGDYTDTVEYGDNISQDSPLPEGYELVNEEDRTVIKENITEDFEYTVVYKKIPVPVPTPDPYNPHNPVVGPTDGNAVKTGDADACWAPLNLILALATCVIAFMMIISMLMRRDDEEIEDTKSFFESSWFERILSGVVGVFALLVFLITENMNLPMAWTDRWTFMMIVIFALQILVAAFAKKKDKAVGEE